MPRHMQGSNGHVVSAAADACVPPVADARAGTTNAAGGFVTNIDARGYQSGTLVCVAGNIAASGTVDSKIQSATASGGSYSDVSGAAVTQFTATDDNTIRVVDFDLDPGEPWLQIVHVQTETGTIASSHVVLRDPRRS